MRWRWSVVLRGSTEPSGSIVLIRQRGSGNEGWRRSNADSPARSLLVLAARGEPGLGGAHQLRRKTPVLLKRSVLLTATAAGRRHCPVDQWGARRAKHVGTQDQPRRLVARNVVSLPRGRVARTSRPALNTNAMTIKIATATPDTIPVPRPVPRVRHPRSTTSVALAYPSQGVHEQRGG